MPGIKKGNYSAKNVGGVTIGNLCKMAGHVLHFLPSCPQMLHTKFKCTWCNGFREEVI